MTLGESIASYISEHQMSLRAFARKTGLSPTYISYLIKGETQRGLVPVPSIETYRVCASAMGKDLDEFIRDIDDDIALNSEKEISKGMQAVLKACKGATDDELFKFARIIEAMRG